MNSLKNNKMSNLTETPGLKILPIKDIVLSETNPRKTFDETSMEELTASVMANGVLQPILVRPKDGKYELVCGERRYRASKAVMTAVKTRNDIPVIIKELTDDEAFEFQIIENLERKDVHPLEEADAFNSMIDCGRYTIEDIAAKMAKPVGFILQRMKLISLIPEIKKDFIAGHLGIGQAVLIARCNDDIQSRIFKESRPWEKKDTPSYYSPSKLKTQIIQNSFDLKSAKFSLENAELVQGCGACLVCPKRSGSNPLLFPDMQDVDRCFDGYCFDAKTDAYTLNLITSIVESGKNIHFITGYGAKPDDAILKLLAKFKITILKDSEFSTYNYREWKETKGLYINGRDRGKYEKIYIDHKAAVIAEDGKAKSPELKSLGSEIFKVEARQERFLELDAEKVFAAVQTIDKTSYFQSEEPLSNFENVALVTALYDKIGYYRRKEIDSRIFPIDVKNINEKLVTTNQLNWLFRQFIIDTLTTNGGNHQRSSNPAAYKLVMDQYFPEEVNAIQTAQDAAATKRIANSNKKIEDLRDQIAIIKAAEVVPPLPVDQMAAAGEKIKKSIKNSKKVLSNEK